MIVADPFPCARVLPDPFPIPSPQCCRRAAKLAVAAIGFDEALAFSLPPHEVRKRWPRALGNCPDCDTPFIGYASLAHYIAGDW